MFWSRLIPETTFLHACLEELGGKKLGIMGILFNGCYKGIMCSWANT